MKTSGRKTVKASTTSAPRASKVSSSPSAATPAAVTASAAVIFAPAAADVAKRSYELFLARGGEHGHDVEDWLQAETELTRG